MQQFDFNNIKTSFPSLLKKGRYPTDFPLRDLELLLQKFPYCQPLHIIQAVQNQNSASAFNTHLSRASLYSPDRTVLYNHTHQKTYSESQSIFQESFYKPIEDPIKQQLEVTIETIKIGDVIEDIQVVEETPFINDIETIIPEQETPVVENETIEHSINTIEEKPIFDTLASSDYFKFNESTADPLAKVADETESYFNQVSKYDDDTMPYSFLWWLHKTRKEHADSYQPYVNFQLDTSQKIKKNPTEELNHQIIENIFHLQIPIQDTPQKENKTIQFEIRRKEEHIIEKFIKDEPQIRPPQPEKIDTENKARKSSEDALDLVSETLAQIYIEQMLYHKAIDIYQKLSLKFPEKSTYFVGQIIELQKKVN